jgi:DHA1 family bicyclomycin/chloramphenicol resistance-like MFS transporter
VGITYPNTTALSLAPFSKNVGTAAALMGAFQMAVGSLTSVVVSLFKSHSSVPMAGTMATAAVIAYIILIVGRRKITEPIDNAAADAETNIIIH